MSEPETTPTPRTAEPTAACWWCGRVWLVKWLIAGHDAWDEQRWACPHCERLLDHVGSLGYRLVPAAARDAEVAALREALQGLCREVYIPHHTPSRESGPEEWDVELLAPASETVERALRLLANPAAAATAHDAEVARAAVEAALSVVYADRNLVVQAYGAAMEMLDWPVAWGVDESEPDWPVLYIETPEGQVSWHIPKAERIYEPPTDRTVQPVKWDGHTDAQKAERLRAAILAANAPDAGETT